MAQPKTESKVAGRRNSVRIVGGAWRGRRVEFPDVPGLRPTPDRVRETLFNWLQRDIAGARVLDLFAGSGALGLEALSRGAAHVTFVERAPEAVRGIGEALRCLGAAERAVVAAMSATRYVETIGHGFDIVFLDPPFSEDALPGILPLLDAGGCLRPPALVYLENARKAGVPELPRGWELLKSKSAGEVGYHLARVSARA